MPQHEVIVSLHDINLSKRSKDILYRNQITTLNDLTLIEPEDLSFRGCSDYIIRETVQELRGVKERADDILAAFEDRTRRISALPDDLKNISVQELNLPTRVKSALAKRGVLTLGSLLLMSKKDIFNLSKVGQQTQKDLSDFTDSVIFSGGLDGASNPWKSGATNPADVSVQSEAETPENDHSGDETPQSRGIDFSVLGVLTERFGFKPMRMAQWFGLSRQRISQMLQSPSQRIRRNWTGNELSDREREILLECIGRKVFDYDDDIVKCRCMNNGRDDFVCLFIYESKVTCFFLDDLPEDIREKIVAGNLQRYTERELSGEADGQVMLCIKKPYFFPNDSKKFRANAYARGLSGDEYAVFLSGCPLGDARMVKDEQITEFFRENLVDGKVHISADPKNQWIKSLASRNGYSIKDFIELFGFESLRDGTELTAEGARERHAEELREHILHDNVVYFPTDSHIYRLLHKYCYNCGISLNDYLRDLGFERTLERPQTQEDILEQDMQPRQSDGTFMEKLFAENPLIGSVMLKPKTLEQLNANAQKCLDAALRNLKLSLNAKMQVALALIHHAKNWNNDENPNFWNYITLQFGYRNADDANGAVVRILQSCLEDAMKMNRRLFLEDSNGRAFKSTILIHALSTRKSWMALFDFLFDFYKNNLRWKIIHGDPLLDTMIQCLRQKFSGSEGENAELNISSHAYSFQEGIYKLILFRPVFARDLFEKLMMKIDSMLNGDKQPVRTYEEQLCEDWFQRKLGKIAAPTAKRTAEYPQHAQTREIAIDYSRIRVKYVLRNETDLCLSIPDIRLKREDAGGASLLVYCQNAVAYREAMSWYGDELGRTLNAALVSLPAFSWEAGEVRVRVRILCGDKAIYDSEETLNRRAWAFHGENEIKDASRIKPGNYTFVAPSPTALEARNAELTEIDDFRNRGLKAFLMELSDAYAVTIDGALFAFDSERGTDFQVITPAESEMLPCVTLGDTEAVLAYRDSVCRIILGSASLSRRFAVLKDNERINLSSLSCDETGRTFAIPLSGSRNACRLRALNLDEEKLLYDKTFLLMERAECGFDREFYYSQDDYKNAQFRVTIDDFSEIAPFTSNEEEVRIPFRNGELHVDIPKITIEESSGAWMDGSAPAWHIDQIPQDSRLYVNAPPGVTIRFLADGRNMAYRADSVTIGNALRSFGREDSELLELQMEAVGAKQTKRYHLASFCYRERFFVKPEFWTQGRKLYWNRGGAFIGTCEGAFTLTLRTGTGAVMEFPLNQDAEYIDLPENMPDDNYRYEISALSGNLFQPQKNVIDTGDCVIGDPNRLRFKNRRIVLEYVTDPDRGRVFIRPCYIERIEFQGVEDTSEGVCPVYSGVLHTQGGHGERYEFSFDQHTNQSGVTKYQVNPVRMVYVNDAFLCITNADGQGLYYYHYTDKGRVVYAITDREYTDKNKSAYSIADLYAYRTERT